MSLVRRIVITLFSAVVLVLALVVPAGAQSAILRVVQGSDGTLYLVQGGNAWTLVPGQISDSDLDGLTQLGEINGDVGLPMQQAPVQPPTTQPSTPPTPPPAPTQPPVSAPAPGLTTTLADGRVVPAYRALDGTLQPTYMRGLCVSALQSWMQGGKLNFFAMPMNYQQHVRNICSAEDVQAAEEGRLQP
jgi:hypothetical protein